MANDNIYGMTPDGFIPKRLADILFDINAKMAEIQDPVTGEYPFQNASDDAILQQVIGVFSEALSEGWNAAANAAWQFDPLKNTRAGQSGTVQLNALLRKPGAPSIVGMLLTGRPGTAIPQGSRIASARDKTLVFTTDAPAVIGADGNAEVQATSVTKGHFDPGPGEITVIQTPLSGWYSAANTAAVSVGTVEESDEELRMRQQRSTYNTSYRLIDAIYAAVANIPGVIYVRAYQNASAYPADARGIPFKEVAVVVEGGGPEAIAEALIMRLPTGQIGYGNTSVVLHDRAGEPIPISFTRPVEVKIYVDVQIRITDRAEYPDDGIDQIKRAVVDYAQYGGIGSRDGFPPGADIVRTRLFTPINSVGGHSIVNMTVGDDPNRLGKTDIEIPWDHVGRFDEGRIVVRLVD